MQFQNREPRWDKEHRVPSGWGNVPEPGPIKKTVHYFYEKLQYMGGERPGRTKQEEMYPDGYEVPAVVAGESDNPGNFGR